MFLPIDGYVNTLEQAFANFDVLLGLRLAILTAQLTNPVKAPLDGPTPPEPQAPDQQTTEQPYTTPTISPPEAPYNPLTSPGVPTVTYDPNTGEMQVSGELPFPEPFFDVPIP